MTVPKLILQLSGSYNSGAMELTSHNGGFSRFDLNRRKELWREERFGNKPHRKIPLNKKGQLWVDSLAGLQGSKATCSRKIMNRGSII